VYFQTLVIFSEGASRYSSGSTLKPRTRPEVRAVYGQNILNFEKCSAKVPSPLSTFPPFHIAMSDDENLQDPLIERPSASPEPSSPPASKKRKRNSAKEPSAGETLAGKKKKKPKSKKVEEDELDLEAGINNAFSHMDSQLLADYVAQRTRRYESDLSSIELEDKYIPGRYNPSNRRPLV
jgi:hypothetical protein